MLRLFFGLFQMEADRRARGIWKNDNRSALGCVELLVEVACSADGQLRALKNVLTSFCCQKLKPHPTSCFQPQVDLRCWRKLEIAFAGSRGRGHEHEPCCMSVTLLKPDCWHAVVIRVSPKKSCRAAFASQDEIERYQREMTKEPVITMDDLYAKAVGCCTCSIASAQVLSQCGWHAKK